MDKKGEVGLWNIVIMAITVLVGIALLTGAIVGNVSKMTSSSTYNSSAGTGTVITIPANGDTIDLNGQELLGTPFVSNNTVVINSSVYTIDEGISATTGLKTIRYTAIGDYYSGVSANISYAYGDDGYIESNGARSIAGLIILFTILLIFISVLPERKTIDWFSGN